MDFKAFDDLMDLVKTDETIAQSAYERECSLIPIHLSTEIFSLRSIALTWKIISFAFIIMNSSKRF